MQVFELHGVDQIVKLAADAHRRDIGRALAVGGCGPTLPEFCEQFRRRMPVNREDEPGVMDRQRGVRCHLARCRAEIQVTAGRVAHCVVRRELGLDLAACVFRLLAGGVHLRARGTYRRDGLADPCDRLAAAQEPSDDIGLLHIAAGRMKVDRTLRVLDAGEKAANTPGRVIIDLALDRDPAVAAWPTCVRCPFGKIDRQPGSKSGCFGRRLFCTQCAGD